ncbi:uncharacterized protein LOC106163078 [Lingula anatina]|uniref:Uncharacterized protein LOC106163078 n=1 Tax=Lingula anatina TaxID=7574 RepID=A0A1S3ICN5_LINAN|nr:uncharacterized protein LOC106163078 [Lingula anatina]|eukprot:XP_013396002.1 uncharacterized protein LOC106163078 [Lingula anatina]
MSESKGKMASLSMPEPPVQRALIEPMFHRPYMEGDFWYGITLEWMHSWKTYVGILSKKGSRPAGRRGEREKSSDGQGASGGSGGPPGGIFTAKLQHSHGLAMVPEDAWNTLFGWYGLADGHHIEKCAVYNYGDKVEIEVNHNPFKVMLSNSLKDPACECHIIRFSKAERVGHIEWKIRETFHVKRSVQTRLWGRLEGEDWQPLFDREKTIGKLLDIDSDFIKPDLALEVSDADSIWRGRPARAENTQMNAVGQFYKFSIFEDLSQSWEKDVHDQIDLIGRNLIQKMHQNFNNFMNRARDNLTERELGIQDSERHLEERENEIAEKMKLLEEREVKLGAQISQHNQNVVAFNKDREVMVAQMEEERQELKKNRDEFETEKKDFQDELKRMSQLHRIQESRVKLDIGGQQFTTALQTLQKEPYCFFARMFSGRHSMETNADGSYFIDRDGTHFRYILNYLRDGEVKEGTMPDNESFYNELLIEAEHYQIRGLVEHLKNLIRQCGKPKRRVSPGESPPERSYSTRVSGRSSGDSPPGRSYSPRMPVRSTGDSPIETPYSPRTSGRSSYSSYSSSTGTSSFGVR